MNDSSTTDKVVVGGALVGGLLFFGFLTSTCTGPLSTGNKDAGDHSKTTSAVVRKVDKNDALVAKFQQDNKALRSELVETTNTLEKSLSILEKKNSRLKQQAEASKRTATTLATRLSAMNGPDSSRLMDKINDLTSELDLSNTKNRNLKKQIAEMSAAPAPEAVAPEKVAVFKSTIKDLNTKNKALTADLAKLSAQLKMANSDKKDAPISKRELLALKDKNNELESELGLSAAKNKNLKKWITEIEAEKDKLNAQVNQFKAQKNIFVKSTDDLPKSAQTLFADLKTLEGKSAEEVSTAYDQITKKNNSEAKARIRFRSGKSNLTNEEKAKIAALTKAAGENSYFLIVGYADKTGSAAANEKLSSARSTSVAKELASMAKGFQAAQAVYLGQTDRFGPSAENRVVEIWEIK